jgi:hypothetical protein
MSIDRSALEQRFEEMGDDELLRRYASGDMTDLAKEVAAAELRRRGSPLDSGQLSDTADASEAFNDAVTRGGDLLCLVRLNNPLEAQVLCGCLEAEGIPALAGDAQLIQANPFLTQAIGGVRIMVYEVDLLRAQDVLKAFQRGDYALTEEDEPL